MLLTELRDDKPLRYEPTAGAKRKIFDGSMHDFKAEIMAKHGVVKRKIDPNTKVVYFLTKQGLVAASWDPFASKGVVFSKN